MCAPTREIIFFLPNAKKVFFFFRSLPPLKELAVLGFLEITRRANQAVDISNAPEWREYFSKATITTC